MFDESRLNRNQRAYVDGARGVIGVFKNVLYSSREINKQIMSVALNQIEASIDEAIKKAIEEMDAEPNITEIVDAEIKKLKG